MSTEAHKTEARALLQQALEQAGENRVLHATLTSLATALDLGPEPKRRTCPTCGAVGMQAASLCGTCWSKLTPPAQLG